MNRFNRTDAHILSLVLRAAGAELRRDGAGVSRVCRAGGSAADCGGEIWAGDLGPAPGNRIEAGRARPAVYLGEGI
jgi:hypothetical protein